jgi:hypothetical protein
MISTYKIHNLENKEITVKHKYKFQSPKNLPKQFFLCGIIGSRGSGKSNSACLINQFYKNYVDNIYLVCPNYENELKLKEQFIESDNVHIYTDPTNETIQTIIDSINNEIKIYKDYVEQLKIWNKFLKIKRIEELSDMEIIEIEKMNYQPPEKIRYTYYPTTLLILDDCINTQLYAQNNKTLNNLAIRHRHLYTNIIFISQHYYSIPRILRTNCSWYLLFNMRDERLLKNIFEEVSNLFNNYDEFKAIFNYATQEPHTFLYIDTDTKKNNIRKNFDNVIIYDELNSIVDYVIDVPSHQL